MRDNHHHPIYLDDTSTNTAHAPPQARFHSLSLSLSLSLRFNVRVAFVAFMMMMHGGDREFLQVRPLHRVLKFFVFLAFVVHIRPLHGCPLKCVENVFRKSFSELRNTMHGHPMRQPECYHCCCTCDGYLPVIIC